MKPALYKGKRKGAFSTENFTAVKIAPGLLKKHKWAAEGLGNSRGGWVGGHHLYLGSSHANLLLHRVRKKPQKFLPQNGRDGRLFLWRLDIVLHLSLSLGVIPAVQLWVTGRAESWEHPHRCSNHPSYTHTSFPESPGQAEHSQNSPK